MRVNIYSQELTGDARLVHKEGTNEQNEKERFTGIRLYLHSARELHHTPDDDDRSAITLWLPKSANRRRELAITLRAMSDLVAGWE